MLQERYYRYLGRNGTITNPIHLEQITPIPMICLRASIGKVLTDGKQKVYEIVVFEDEIANWEEIDDFGQN